MGTLVTLCLGLLLVAGVRGQYYVTGPQMVFGIDGGSVDVECRYGSSMTNYVKVWCQVFGGTCTDLATTDKGTNYHGMSIKDDKLNNKFIVTLSQLKEHDSGRYHCKVKKSRRTNLGTGYENYIHEVELKVLPAPETVIGTVGGSVIVDCSYSVKFTRYRKSWCQVHQSGSCNSIAEVNPGGVFSGRVTVQDDVKKKKVSVTLTRLQETDAGRYRCEFVLNGDSMTQQVELKVFNQPGLRVQETVSSESGGSVVINCEYSQEYMNKEKYWCKMQDGECKNLLYQNLSREVIMITDNQHKCSLTLSMTLLSWKNAGQYICIIKEFGRFISKNVELKIIDIKGPATVNGTAGGSVNIQCNYTEMYQYRYAKYWCKVDANGQCTRLLHTYYKRKQPRSSIVDQTWSESLVVTMSMLEVSDEGLYRCGIEKYPLLQHSTDVRLNVFPGENPTTTVEPLPTKQQEDHNTKSVGPTTERVSPIVFVILGILALLLMIPVLIFIKRKCTKRSGGTITFHNNGTSFHLREIQTTSSTVVNENQYVYHTYFQPAISTSNVNVLDDDSSTDSSDSSDSSSTEEPSRFSRYASLNLNGTAEDELEQAHDYVNVSEDGWIDPSDYVNVPNSNELGACGAPRKAEEDYVNVEPSRAEQEREEEQEGVEREAGVAEKEKEEDSSEEDEGGEIHEEDGEVTYSQVVFK
ncbi:polymeric immunoglobulin receptor isoform X2 [Lepisosteus oculatus]|uniref:polymeric immunoglobulin receptor isoform X2 n=1 Tax=Lepisosteus oculatus TaxID=7918 RepID=UPI00371281BE